ncbi:GYD domain-containing protein [Polaromonas sp.]|uniref:GYD domain-containing protein n=1 Tax=Polaromonas sp. TaxID=1869339 RepID=UPI0013BA3FAA|nr:GYD domain-containing protein [Polaromonas sp.]NDP64941.1 GYD domain-containing protein [Polaromonas sp.]
MKTYIALCHFTDQGMHSVKDTTKRADAVRELAKKFGASMSQLYWTSGRYDLVAVIEADDEESANAFGLSIGVAGNIRTEMLRAFSKDEMNAILGKMA